MGTAQPAGEDSSVAGGIGPGLKRSRLYGAGYRLRKLVLNFNRHLFFSNVMRMAIYRALGVKADEGAMIWCGNPRINHADRISIGRNSILGPGNVLLSQGGIEIGENVDISGFSFLISQEHDVASPRLATRLAPIRIDDAMPGSP